MILTISRDHSVRIWNAISGQLVTSPLRKLGPASQLAARISPDRKRLLISQTDHTRLYDFSTSELVGPMILGAGIKRVGCIRDRDALLTVNEGNAVQVWDPANGREVFDFGKNLENELPLPFEANLAPYNPSFLPESIRTHSLIASADGEQELLIQENTAWLRDAKTHQAIAAPLSHRERSSWGAFSPDGRQLVTCGFDASARVWDARTGQPLAPPLTHSLEVDHGIFSRDGRWLATLSRSEDTVKVWNLTPDSRPVEDLVALAQLLTGRQINEVGSQVEVYQPQVIKTLWDALHKEFFQDSSTAKENETAASVQEALHFFRRSERFSGLRSIAPEQNPGLWEWRSRLNMLGGAWNEAVEEVSKAVQLEPRQANLWHQRGLCSMQLKQWAEAIADFDQALQVEPRQAMSWNRRGLCLAQLQREAEALESFSRAIQLQPASPGFWEERGRMHVAAGRLGEALADFARAQDLISGRTATRSNRVQPLESFLPKRDSRAQPLHLDLSRFYNMTLMPPMSASPWPSLRLTSVLPDFRKYAGIDFDARGIIALSSPEVLYQCGSFPKQVLGIPVQARCRRIHFLRSALFTDTAGNDVGRFVVPFSDGQPSELPLKFEVNTGVYWLRSGVRHEHTVAVSLHHDEADPQTLFVTRWNNPRPEAPVVMIDFISANNHAAPFLLAISTED